MEINRKSNPSSSSRTDRKTVEKNRRNQMKSLFSQLNSLVPHQNPIETTPLPDQVEEAARYIKRLQTNVERLRVKKDGLMGVDRTNAGNNVVRIRSPEIEVHEMGSTMEVVLITGLDCQFLFNETVRLLHEEGAEIVNASFSVVHDTVFHTIHCKVADSDPHQASTISERLKKFVNMDAR